MKINELNIKAFGHFTDFPVQFDDTKSFHLIHGNNEAGKSTLLRSISDYFYGIPNTTRDNFLHKNSQLRIEGTITTDDGEIKTYTRRKGNKNTLLDTENNSVDELELNRTLHHLSRENFEQMFGINHERIREGSEALLKSGGQAGEGMFSATSGTSMISNVKEALEKAASDKYKKSGKNPVINRLLGEIKELTKKMNELALNSDRWLEVEADYEASKERINELNEEKKALRLNLTKLERIRKNLPDLKELETLQFDLENLEMNDKITFEVVEIKKDIEHSIEESERTRQHKEEQLNELLYTLGTLTLNDDIISEGGSIEGLYRQSDKIESDLIESEELSRRHKVEVEQLKGLLLKLEGREEDFRIIESYRLSYGIKSEVEQQIEIGKELNSALEQIENELKRIEADIATYEKEINLIEVPKDLTSLEKVLNELNHLGDLEQKATTSVQVSESLKEKMGQAFAKIGQWKGSAKELYELKITILDETIILYGKNLEQLADKEKELRKKQKEAKTSILIQEKKLTELQQNGEIPTLDELTMLREQREQKWSQVKEHLYGKSSVEEDEKVLAISFEGVMEKTDEVSDYIIENSQAVADKKHCLSIIQEAMKTLEVVEKQLVENEKVWLEQNERWHGLWEECGIIPLSPQEMQEWKRHYAQFMMDMGQYELSIVTKIKDEELRDEYTREIVNVLTEMGVQDDLSQQSLRSLKDLAQKLLNHYREENSRLSHVTEEKEKRIANMKQVEYQKEKLRQKWDTWHINWKNLLKETTISIANPQPQTVQIILKGREECIHLFDQIKRLETTMSTLNEFIVEKRTEIARLLKRLGVNLSIQHLSYTINELYTSLQEARSVQERHKQVTSTIGKLENDLTLLKVQWQNLKSEFNEIMHACKYETIQDFSLGILAFEQGNQIVSKQQEITIRLLGDERIFTIDELKEEATAYNRDELQIELEEVNESLEQLEQELGDLQRKFGVQEKEYNEKVQGSNNEYAAAMAQKESLLAELEREVNAYVTYRLSSSLLQKGIEYYREQNQNPILHRSSELFANLTKGNFIGIDVDYDNQDEVVLVGVRNDGSKVQIAGMSDGTQDQLYLALRIAGIEQFIKQSGPIPFIVDDILVHFDDERSKVTLKELIHLSKKTQIIFFTHHVHIVELVKEVLEEMNEDVCQFIQIGSVDKESLMV